MQNKTPPSLHYFSSLHQHHSRVVIGWCWFSHSGQQWTEQNIPTIRAIRRTEWRLFISYIIYNTHICAILNQKSRNIFLFVSCCHHQTCVSILYEGRLNNLSDLQNQRFPTSSSAKSTRIGWSINRSSALCKHPNEHASRKSMRIPSVIMRENTFYSHKGIYEKWRKAFNFCEMIA